MRAASTGSTERSGELNTFIFPAATFAALVATDVVAATVVAAAGDGVAANCRI